MRKVKELKPAQVYKTCNLKSLKFRTTDDLTPCTDYIGQERAVQSIHFGLGMEFSGYNIYLGGPTGVGKTTIIDNILKSIAKDKPKPPDWCYVFNFQDPDEPRSIELPTGKGKEFKSDMEDFLQDLQMDIPRAFESKEFEEQKQDTMNTIHREKNNLFEALQKNAKDSGIQVQFSPTGIITIPLVNGQPVTPENYNTLDDETKEEIKVRKEKVDLEVAEVLKTARKLEREASDKVKELEKKVALFSVRDLIDIIREKYKAYPQIIDYFDQLQKHILENIDHFLPPKQGPVGSPVAAPMPYRMPQQEPPFTEYKVNVFIDNSNTQGAPVIFETHPTYSNLFGSIEKEARFGALVTDFTMIRPGSMAKASGGYLVIDALDLFKYPFVWDSLKKALENEELRIEDVYQQYGFSSTVGIRPEPVKLDAKVIIAGNSQLYSMLYAYDEDFRKLFKAKADFDYIVDRDDSTLFQYACYIKSVCDREGLKKFDRSGVERVIEYSSRHAGDQNKLSLQLGSMTKILSESNYWAGLDNSKSIKRTHVEKAVEEKIYRSRMVEDKIQEMIAKGTILVDTQGIVVGQINGLSVYNMGDYAFGKPSRITCETYMGTEGLINIDRRAKLSGSIHDKGVMILSGFIGTEFAQNKPLSLSASIGFEQSYEMIDGDSASAAELVILLSSLSGVPIKQSFAITGSVNQKGQIQPIGGVNEKVEGFYQVCKAKGITGEQSVIIPYQNVRNLMLNKEIVQAVKDKKFHIYPVETVNQAIELLTGKEAGKKSSTGKFKTGTINYLVDKRLREFAEEYRKFGRPITNSNKKGNGAT